MRDERVRLVLLLAILASLVAYLAASRTGAFGLAGGSSAAPPVLENCPVEGAPPVATIRRAQLLSIRDDLYGLARFDRGLAPYEQGLVGSLSAWTDREPGTDVSLPASPRVRGGYELRWRMASGDTVVADGMVFSSERRTRDFFERASSARCRQAGAASAASLPPGGRNLEWLNPAGYGQEDIFLLRGRRVYRVAVVQPGARGGVTVAARHAGFSLVSGLACALPGAGCPVGR